MRELVLTHITQRSDGIATIAFVDYVAYTATVKRVNFDDDYDKSPELNELLGSGKLRPYREKLESSMDAWLAHDPVRGCLVVTDSGLVKCFPADEYVCRVSAYESLYYYTVCNEFNPRRLGSKMHTSFWEMLNGIKENLGKPLSDETVRNMLAALTGVVVNYCVDSEWVDKTMTEVYTVLLNGLDVDRLDLECSLSSAVVKIYGGMVEELHVGGKGSFRIIGKGGPIKRVTVYKDVTELCFSCDESPQLYPASNDCALESLEGYNRRYADFSAFTHLKSFNSCWDMSEHSAFSQISITLPGAPDTSFVRCFCNVAIENMRPYRDDIGNLRLTGIQSIKDSFLRFIGLESITGYVDFIEHSFLSCNFGGRFDIDVAYLSYSFGYGRQSSGRTESAYSSDEIYNPEGVVRIHLQPEKHPQTGETVGRTYGMGVLLNKTRYLPWKQRQILDYAAQDSHIVELKIGIYKNVTFEINSFVKKCRVQGDSKEPQPKFNKIVDTLSSGLYPYKGVRRFGAKCFAHISFPKTHICELQEGVTQSIGDRAFYSSHNISYLVIPKSCSEIGIAAFSEMTNGSGDLTTICVYRGSYGHKWSKGKKLKILIIDSVDEIPTSTSAESETDFIAAFVETPSWSKESRAFVAKLLYADAVDLLCHIPVVAELSDESTRFFSEQYASYNDVARHGVAKPLECLDDIQEGFISCFALNAAALNAVYGSYVYLLDPVVLKRFIWEPWHVHEVTRWYGTPKVTGYYKGPQPIVIYVRGNEVLYVGCGDIYSSDLKEMPWAIPRKVISSDSLFGPEVEGRLTVRSYRGIKDSFTVCEETLQDKAYDKFAEFLHNSMVVILSQLTGKSGRKRVRDNFVYDIVNAKIYRFSSLTEGMLGTYRGEVPIREFIDIHGSGASGVKESEDARALLAQYTIGRAKEAAPCFEAEYARTHPPFMLNSTSRHVVQVKSFIELLSRSGLVKRLSQSGLSGRATSQQQYDLSDGTRVLSCKSPLGYTHLLGIWHKRAFYGFEAAFDMINLANTLDNRINGMQKYPRPNRGYFDITDTADIFKVSPQKGSSDGVAIAIDLLSGKLVLALYDGSNAGLICSFDSAKDVRNFYTAFGCRFLAPPTEPFIDAISTSLYMHREGVDNNGILKKM